MATVPSSTLHGVFKALLNGVHERGDGGVLFVRGGECAYRFPREFADAQFRGHLEEVLENDDARGLYFVVEERDRALHLLAYPKDRVWKDAFATPAAAAAATADAAAATADAAPADAAPADAAPADA
jgi:hypothetical protein